MSEVVGVILAGGLARRMGRVDKTLVSLAGRPLLAWIVERAAPQVARLILSANGDPARFASFGVPVVADTVPDFAGPLAGILAALEWTMANAPNARWVASFPGDAPFVPRDLVARLVRAQASEDAELVCGASAGRTNPACGLWCVDLANDLRNALAEGLHKVDAWTARYRLAIVEFPIEPIDPFFNINRPEDIGRAEALAALYSGTPP